MKHLSRYLVYQSRFAANLVYFLQIPLHCLHETTMLLQMLLFQNALPIRFIAIAVIQENIANISKN